MKYITICHLAIAIILAATLNSAQAVVTVGNTGSAIVTAGSPPYTLAGFDASASDKLVVTVGTEGSAGATPKIASITYGGFALREAVQTSNSSNNQQVTAIYYMDAPSTAGDIVVNWYGDVNGSGISAMALSGTAPGYAMSNGNDGQSVNLTTTANDTFVVASFVANSGATSAVTPLNELYASSDIGSAGGATGYQNVATAGSNTFSFTGSNDRPVTVAAGFNEGVTNLGAFELVASQTFEDPSSGVNFSAGLDLDTDISDATAFATLSAITNGTPNAAFTGAEGSDYFYGQRTDDETKSLLFDAVDLSAYSDTRLHISLAANPGKWDDSPDDLVILLDKDNDGTFETTLADAYRISTSNLVLENQTLGMDFQDYLLFLPEDATNAALRIDFTTSGDSEEAIGIDNVRFFGRQPITSASVPEPSTFALGFLGLALLVWRRKTAK